MSDCRGIYSVSQRCQIREVSLYMLPEKQRETDTYTQGIKSVSIGEAQNCRLVFMVSFNKVY